MKSKSILVSLALLAAFTLPMKAQEKPQDCSLCTGVAVDLSAPAPAGVPLLVDATSSTPDALMERVGAIDPVIRRRSTIVLGFSSVPTSLEETEKQVVALVDLGSRLGPFRTAVLQTPAMPAELQAYAVKRFAISAEGRSVADEIGVLFSNEVASALQPSGALSYVDAWLAPDAATVEPLTAWLEQNDPGKRIVAFVKPNAANPLFDAAQAFARGASSVFLRSDDAALPAAIVSLNHEFSGDFAFDKSSGAELLDAKGAPLSERPLVFVRGEDLRSVVIVPGNREGSSIVSVSADDGMNPRRIDASGATAIRDTAKKNRRLLIGMQPYRAPFVLTFDRPPLDVDVAKETIDVATKRGISVEEIVRRHQAYHDYQASIAPRYIARNATKLRFSIGAGEQVEATLAGPHFFDPNGSNDWVWSDLYINGVRWKYGRIPELPLIQPEKVSQLPLDIHLTNEYVYELVGETNVGPFKAYEVRFAPPKNAPVDLPLYRGTVWIDQRTFARLRIAMVQLNLSGEILSNEERLEYAAFESASGRAVSNDEATKLSPRSLLWLPLRVDAQQVLSTAGRTTAVTRVTDFSNFQLSPADFAARLAEVSKSEARMVRDTEEGLRYLERRGDGTRVVKEGFDTSKMFLLGGLHHDPGLEYPVVPLGGIDYFNFDVAKKGLQSNVFFAGVILAANIHDPSFLGSRFNVGGDMFGLAVPVENTLFRNGVEMEDEAVKDVPFLVAGRVGRPVLGFGKLDFSVGVSHHTYQRAETTARGFEVPSDTFEIVPGIDFSYERRGWTFALGGERGARTSWQPWGNLSEYDESQKNFSRWKAAVGHSFSLPKFQRIGVELDYLDGRNLDRFSKYELGFFGSQRVRGIQSGSVRAEKAFLGHLSYGFVISDQLRLEAFYDHALLDDATAGYRREPFQGVGIAGQTVGPFGTLLRLDIGKSIGRNAQDDWVADVVFLKIFR